MFDITVRHLARVFVNAGHVQVHGTAYSRLLSELGDDFLPRPITELTPAGTVQRLGAATSSGEWLLSITSESIDVTYSPRLGTAGSVSFAQYCESAARYVGIAHRLVNAPAHRFAVVREGLATKTPLQLDALGALLLREAPSLTEQMFEWDWRAATRVAREFGAHSEPTNTIGGLKRVEVAFPGKEPVDQLMVSTDINTPPQRTRPRFEPGDAEAFVLASAAWHSQLEDVLKTLTEGN